MDKKEYSSSYFRLITFWDGEEVNAWKSVICILTLSHYTTKKKKI